jgi:2'-5' RNA ligase
LARTREPGAGTVEADGSVRLFLGLPVPPSWLEPLCAWQRANLAGSASLRLVPAPDLHATLVFLGYRAGSEVGSVSAALRTAASGREAPTFGIASYRETRTVAMLVLTDRDGLGAVVQRRLAEELARSGLYEPEARPWLPHVTVARVRERPPGLHPPLPLLDEARPSEVALYSSVLRSGGAQYEIIDSVALRT